MKHTPTDEQRCPKCGGAIDFGFGLAGGGYGPYRLCTACCTIIEGWPEFPDEEEEKKA